MRTKRKGCLALLVVGALLLLSLVGCGATEGARSEMEETSASGTLDVDEGGNWLPFTVPVEAAGDRVGVDFRGALQTGSVRVQVVGEDGALVWEEAVSTPGPFAVNTVVEPPAAGEYELGLAWDGPVTASYSLTWQPGEVEVGRVSPLALLSGLGMIAVAVGFVVYAAVRRLGWGFLGLGALAWMLTVGLKFAMALGVNTTVYQTLQGALPEQAANLVFYLYVGSLTGVFEVIPIWLVMRHTRLGRMSWNHALGFGIGFGVVEALLLGVQSLINVGVAVFVPALLPLGPEMIAQLNNPIYLLAPIVERFFTVLVHIFTNLLIIYGARARRPGWFWLAFAYKSAIDAVAAFAQIQGWTTMPQLWLIEAMVVVWGVVAWLGIGRLRLRWNDGQALAEEGVHHGSGVGSEAQG
jgi:uncharacterized membrane protein YhfC